MMPTSPPPSTGEVKNNNQLATGVSKSGGVHEQDGESARRMKRAATKRAREEMAMATVTRMAVERRRRG